MAAAGKHNKAALIIYSPYCLHHWLLWLMKPNHRASVGVCGCLLHCLHWIRLTKQHFQTTVFSQVSGTGQKCCLLNLRGGGAVVLSLSLHSVHNLETLISDFNGFHTLLCSIAVFPNDCMKAANHSSKERESENAQWQGEEDSDSWLHPSLSAAWASL